MRPTLTRGAEYSPWPRAGEPASGGGRTPPSLTPVGLQARPLLRPETPCLRRPGQPPARTRDNPPDPRLRRPGQAPAWTREPGGDCSALGPWRRSRQSPGAAGRGWPILSRRCWPLVVWCCPGMVPAALPVRRWRGPCPRACHEDYRGVGELRNRSPVTCGLRNCAFSQRTSSPDSGGRTGTRPPAKTPG